MAGMKKRIKIDSAILTFLILLTGCLYVFPQLYATPRFWDQVFDLVGFISIFMGVFMRMAARSHKKLNSQEGHGLVISGPYQHVRNPMYLGTFLLGFGFILMVWPWWLLPVFVILFYLRFRRQVLIEEEHLQGLFGQEYEKYCRRVPRLFPRLRRLSRARLRDHFAWRELWLTKEKFALLGWPLFAFMMELGQEKLIFGSFFVLPTLVTLLVAIMVFEFFIWSVYRRDA